MYPEVMVIPMREELTRIGIKETRTAAEVAQAVAQPGTTMVIVNSICGCAAGKMRPAVRLALQQGTAKPDQSITVFAGQDRDATEKARNYLAPNPPSSPSIGLLRDGKLLATVHVGSRPDAMALSPNQNFLFVVDTAAGDVAVVRAAALPFPVLLTMIPVGQQPNAIVVKAFILRKPPQP